MAVHTAISSISLKAFREPWVIRGKIGGKINYYWSYTAFWKCGWKSHNMACTLLYNRPCISVSQTCPVWIHRVWLRASNEISRVSHWFASCCDYCHNQEVMKGHRIVLLHLCASTHLLFHLHCHNSSPLRPANTTNPWFQRQIHLYLKRHSLKHSILKAFFFHQILKVQLVLQYLFSCSLLPPNLLHAVILPYIPPSNFHPTSGRKLFTLAGSRETLIYQLICSHPSACYSLLPHRAAWRIIRCLWRIDSLKAGFVTFHFCLNSNLFCSSSQ